LDAPRINLILHKADGFFTEANYIFAIARGEYVSKIRSVETVPITHSANRPHCRISCAYRRSILSTRRLLEITMLNRKFVLLIMTGALFVGGSSLSCASSVSNAAVKADGNGGTEQQQPMGASHPGPFAQPAAILETAAKSENQTSTTGASVLDGQDPSTGPIPESRFFTYPVMFPD
jgi:hypothetical protein